MKKFLFALPVILLVAAGCSSSTTTQPTGEQSVVQNTSPTVIPSAQPTPKNNLGVNSKVFTNAKYGYQFQYPSSGLSETPTEKTYSNQNADGAINQDVVEFGYGTGKATYEITTYIGVISKSRSLQSWISEAMGINNNIQGYNQVTIGGRMGFLDKQWSEAFVGDGANVFEIRAVETDSQVSIIANNDQTFNLILSTFTLTNN